MNLLQKFKALLDAKFAMYTLKDGSQIDIDGELALGTLVYSVNPETGEKNLLQPGYYALQDPAGMVISINDSGAIAEMTTETEEATETEAKEQEMESAEEIVGEVREEVVTEIVDTVKKDEIVDASEDTVKTIAEAVISLVEEKVSGMETQIAEMTKKLEAMNCKFAEDLEAIKKLPSATTVSGFKFAEEEDKPVSVTQARANFIKKYKNNQK